MNNLKYLQEKLSKEQLQEAIRKEYARRSLFEFVKYTFPFPVKWNWHHIYTCSILQKFTEGHYPRLMIFMPPQHQKTTLMTEYTTAWSFGKTPDLQTLLIMYDSPMAEKYNRRIQRIIDSDVYRDIFPNTKLNSKNTVSDNRQQYVRNTREFEIVDHIGFFKSVGVGGGIAGNPAKVALLDDVIKNIAEANSPTYRNNIYEWYTDELETRLHNDSRVAFTITRRHEEDLAGKLIKRDGRIEDGGKWKVITIPAIKEDNTNPDDPRNIGDALFPELHSLERLIDIKIKNPRTFTSLYQQRPSPEEGNKIKRHWFEIIDEIPGENKETPLTVDLYIDGAYTKNTQNDPTGLMTCKYDAEKEILYITNFYEDYLEMPDLLGVLKVFPEPNGMDATSSTRIEPKATGITLRQLINNDNEIKLNASEIEGKHVGIGKPARADACAPTMQAGKVKLIKGSWNEQFLSQLTMFPNAKHDEAVDNLCYAIYDKFIEGNSVFGIGGGNN